MDSKNHRNFSDPTFIEALKKRESMATNALVRAYTSHLYKAGLGMGFAEEQAHDLCHSTWATFFEVIERFEGRSHIRTFLFGIFYNKASEARRANLKFFQNDPFDIEMESWFQPDGHWKEAHGDPGRFVEACESIQILEDCLSKLPELQKSVFSLKMIQEEESEEICNILNISSTNLRQLLFRGKNRLRECIEKRVNA